MSHLAEEELVEHYYGRNAAGRAAQGSMEDHLATCADCARAYSALQGDLNDIAVLNPPARDASYGEQVWQAIAPSLPVYEARKHAWMGVRLWRGLAYAAACALLVTGAFFAGRVWEQRQQPRITAVKQAPAPQRAPEEVKQRVVVVVLSDHLDRSERFLVQLKHADMDSTEMALPLKDEARSLLEANRICRKNAAQGSDPALTNALDRLDELLAKLANRPDGLNAAALAELQKEMKSQNLLFEVRVLRSRVPPAQPGHNAGLKGGNA